MRQREWRRRERRCSIQRKGGLFDGDREELRRAGDKEQLEKEKKNTRNCSRSGERDRGRQDGGEEATSQLLLLNMCCGQMVVNYVLRLLYFCTGGENEPTCGTKCFSVVSTLRPGGGF